jgi:hypothetical protein
MAAQSYAVRVEQIAVRLTAPQASVSMVSADCSASSRFHSARSAAASARFGIVTIVLGKRGITADTWRECPQ